MYCLRQPGEMLKLFCKSFGSSGEVLQQSLAGVVKTAPNCRLHMDFSKSLLFSSKEMLVCVSLKVTSKL